MIKHTLASHYLYLLAKDNKPLSTFKKTTHFHFYKLEFPECVTLVANLVKNPFHPSIRCHGELKIGSECRRQISQIIKQQQQQQKFGAEDA